MPKTSDLRKRLQFCEFCAEFIHCSRYNFKAHLFRHNAVEARYKCKFCSREYFRSDTYYAHVRRHEGKSKVNKKSYICDYCDKSFMNRATLILHLKRIHDDRVDANVGKFLCNVCQLEYCERRILEQHIRKVHFNLDLNKEPSHFNKSVNESWIEKVVNKNACVQITKVNNNVITIKPLNDADVKTDYTTPKSVKHESQYVDQYSMAICDYCKKKMIKKSLRLHIQEVHMNRRKFKCKECKQGFKRNYRFTNHICGRGRRSKKKKIK